MSSTLGYDSHMSPRTLKRRCDGGAVARWRKYATINARVRTHANITRFQLNELAPQGSYTYRGLPARRLPMFAP